jgi:hypothetical protein
MGPNPVTVRLAVMASMVTVFFWAGAASAMTAMITRAKVRRTLRL